MSTGPAIATPTIEIARKVLSTVDQGLCSGLGNPKPGQMCVEAAVCYAYGLPHGDNPPCVSVALRSFKIALNDKAWSSKAARAKGMRRLAIAQLGSNGMDDRAFVARLAELTIRRFVPIALRSAAKLNPKFADRLEAAAKECEATGTREAAIAGRDVARETRAYAAADADAAAAADAAAYAAADAYAAAYAAADAYADAYADAAADAAAAAYADAYAAAYARDSTYTLAAEMAIEVLRELNQPGIALMDELCPHAGDVL